LSKSFPNHRGHGKYAPDDYRTPEDLYEGLNHRFGPHTLDAAANEQNAKCSDYFTVETNGLFQKWSGNVWLNPPWHSIDPWVDKAILSAEEGATVTLLLPCRTGTKWFGKVIKRADSIHFIRGRVSFTGPHSPEGGKSIEDSFVVRITPPWLLGKHPAFHLMNNLGEAVTEEGWVSI